MDILKLVTLSLLFAAALADGKEPTGDLLQKYRDAEKVVVEKLSDEAIWKDNKQKESLLQYLDAAKKVRLEEVADVLVNHMEYTPYALNDAFKIAEDRYPATAAIISIGLPSVPPLLKLLKSSSRDGDYISQLRHNLTIHCLIGIYGQGGYGGPLAKARLELELKTTSGKEKLALQQALEHPRLKE